MKKYLVVMAAIAIVIAMGATVYGASGTVNVTTNANVTGVCLFNSGPTTLTIGAIDPSSAGPATASGSLNYACTTNTVAPHITQDAGTSSCVGATAGTLGGALYLKGTGAGGTCMKYTIGSTLLTANGFSAWNTATITASIAGTDFQNQPADNYTDTVVLTIVY
jgi:hypothetical protein